MPNEGSGSRCLLMKGSDPFFTFSTGCLVSDSISFADEDRMGPCYSRLPNRVGWGLEGSLFDFAAPDKSIQLACLAIVGAAAGIR